jgi:hypothetical protein
MKFLKFTAAESTLNATLILSGLTVCSPAEAAPLVLVDGGQSKSIIVLANSSSSVARDAAKELQQYFKAASGADVPVKQEKALSASDRANALVLVGDSELARETGLDVKALKPEGFVQKRVGNRVILAGREDKTASGDPQQGTRYAVSAFLEDQLGVRWLWPGAMGEVVPRRPTVAIDTLDRSDAPALVQRQLRDLLVNKSPRFTEPRRVMRVTDEQQAQMLQASSDWFVRQRLGGHVKLNARHAFTEWWDLYHEKHPEWFAMHLNGSRDWPERIMGEHARVKICVSNPEVLDQFVADAVAFFRNRPGEIAFSASPNDSAMTGNCMCPTCKSWDVPEAQKYELTSMDAAGKRVAFEYPSLSDRYARFYNLAADRLAKVVPGKNIIGIAYGAWTTPPIREKFRDNVIIGFVGYASYMSDADRAKSTVEWAGLTEKASKMYLRPNTLYHSYGFPLVFTHRMAEDLRRCFDTGMMGVDIDSLIHHWGGNGLNYYVLSKLLWNPHADVDAIVTDFCKSGFGTAAPAIQDYFDAVERQTNRIAAINAWGRGKLPELEMLPLWTPQVLSELQGHLDRARTLTKNSQDLDRIGFLQVGMDYVRLQLAAVDAVRKAKESPTPENVAARKQTLEARQQFYRLYKTSFAINVPMALFRQSSRSDAFYGISGEEAARLLQQMEDEEA